MEGLLNTLIVINVIWLCCNIYYDFFVNSRHRHNLKVYKKAFEMILDRNVEACVMEKSETDAIKYRVFELTK